MRQSAGTLYETWIHQNKLIFSFYLSTTSIKRFPSTSINRVHYIPVKAATNGTSAILYGLKCIAYFWKRTKLLEPMGLSCIYKALLEVLSQIDSIKYNISQLIYLRTTLMLFYINQAFLVVPFLKYSLIKNFKASLISLIISYMICQRYNTIFVSHCEASFIHHFHVSNLILIYPWPMFPKYVKNKS